MPCRQGLDVVTKDLMVDVFTTNAIGPLLVVQQLRKHGLLKRPALVANVTSKVISKFNLSLQWIGISILGLVFDKHKFKSWISK